jgi:hypothetical protein
MIPDVQSETQAPTSSACAEMVRLGRDLAAAVAATYGAKRAYDSAKIADQLLLGVKLQIARNKERVVTRAFTEHRTAHGCKLLRLRHPSSRTGW